MNTIGIEDAYRNNKISRETAGELLSELGYSDEIIETRLDLRQDEKFNVEDKINELINEEKQKEISFIHSSIVEDDEVKYFLLRFARKLLNESK